MMAWKGWNKDEHHKGLSSENQPERTLTSTHFQHVHRHVHWHEAGEFAI